MIIIKRRYCRVPSGDVHGITEFNFLVDLTFLQFFGDDFLRVLLLRFIFCCVALRLHKRFRVSSVNFGVKLKYWSVRMMSTVNFQDIRSYVFDIKLKYW